MQELGHGLVAAAVMAFRCRDVMRLVVVAQPVASSAIANMTINAKSRFMFRSRMSRLPGY